MRSTDEKVIEFGFNQMDRLRIVDTYGGLVVIFGITFDCTYVKDNFPDEISYDYVTDGLIFDLDAADWDEGE